MCPPRDSPALSLSADSQERLQGLLQHPCPSHPGGGVKEGGGGVKGGEGRDQREGEGEGRDEREESRRERGGVKEG